VLAFELAMDARPVRLDLPTVTLLGAGIARLHPALSLCVNYVGTAPAPLSNVPSTKSITRSMHAFSKPHSSQPKLDTFTEAADQQN
jgi:hypothetical protein